MNVLLGEPAPVIGSYSSGSNNVAGPTGSIAPTSKPGQGTPTSGSSVATPVKSMEMPPTPSSSSGGSRSGSGGSSGGLSDQSSSKIDDKKNNVKSPESSATITQPSSWMMAGVSALLAALAF